MKNLRDEIAKTIGVITPDDPASCIAPRRLLIVSAEDDKYSRDASYIVEKASPAYAKLDALQKLQHKRYSGGHALTTERFDFMIEWIYLNANTFLNDE